MDEKNPDITPENNENNNTFEDDFVIGKGFEISEEPIMPAPKKRGAKHSAGKNTLKNIIWILCIVVVSVGLAFGIIFAGADYMGIGFGRGNDCEVVIEQGMSTGQIAEQLKECGAVKIPMLFRVYAKLKHYDGKFKYGLYTFNNEAGYEALSVMLIEEGA